MAFPVQTLTRFAAANCSAEVRLLSRPARWRSIRSIRCQTEPSRDLITTAPLAGQWHAAHPALLHSRSASYVAGPAGFSPQRPLHRTSRPRSARNLSSSVALAQDPNDGKEDPRPEPPDHLNAKERELWDKLNEAFSPVALQVEDISGGCGSMYAVSITSDKFRGLSVIKQHRLVNGILGEDIKQWHGIQLRTKAA